MDPRFSILIPSRLEGPGEGKLFLESAVASVRAQTLAVPPQILVGLDLGVIPPAGLAEALDVTFVNSTGRSQAEALNAAASRIDGDHVALLEDDDRWSPHFLTNALTGLERFDFVSSTQLEILEDNQVVRVNDFPTPSGWVMRRDIWQAVGGFDPAWRWHLDNEWLGRLSRSGARRVHLVEATAPGDLETARGIRPVLADVILSCQPQVVLGRHASPWPLVIRLLHAGGGMQRILANPALKAQSQEEIARLHVVFGGVPS